MEQETNIFLSEDDREFFDKIIHEKIEDRITLCKKQDYTEFQKKLLSMDIEIFNEVISCFLCEIEKNRKSNENVSNKIFNTKNKKDFIECLESSKDSSEMKVNIKKISKDIQCVVLFEIIDLMKKVRISDVLEKKE